MAAAVRAKYSYLLSPAMLSATIHRFRLTPPSASIRFRLKRIKRKNHLRPKILKTLTKPLTTVPLPQIVPAEKTTAPIPIPLSPENGSVSDTVNEETEIPCETLPADESGKLSEFQSSETINSAGVFGNISVNSVLKFCVYLVGILMIQTICTFWFLESADSSKKEKRLIDLNGEGSVLANGSNVAYFEGTEMEDKINEIRAMAKEARKREKLDREDDNEENDIEKEISARLAKLEEKLSSKRENMPGSFMNYLGLFGSEEEEDGVDEKNLELGEDQTNLIFRKKHIFRSPSMESRTNNPKGFSGSSKPSSNSLNGSGPNGLTDTEREAMDKQFNSSQIDGDNLRQEKLNLQKESDSVTESSKSKKFETKINQKAPKKPNGFAGKRPKAKAMEKKTVVQTDLWWLNLPYVLAILIRRGPENESAGFYVLRTLNGADYNVAFEDRGDANNFCYLLESFFEDLGNFRADIVPLSTKDIQEEVKSRTKNIIVVKKGQLKLYAGQPLAEVEMALRSLI